MQTAWHGAVLISSHLCSVQSSLSRCCWQWRRYVVKYGGQGQSDQAIKLFQAPREISFTFNFWHKSFILDDVKLTKLSGNNFKWKIYCDILGWGSWNILWLLLHIFRGSRPHNPRIYAHGCRTEGRRTNMLIPWAGSVRIEDPDDDLDSSP